MKNTLLWTLVIINTLFTVILATILVMNYFQPLTIDKATSDYLDKQTKNNYEYQLKLKKWFEDENTKQNKYVETEVNKVYNYMNSR